MTDRVGQQLGNYYLTRLLGWGGFADVYLGRHVHLNTLAAIKVLHAPIPTEDIDQFLNEARTLVRLEHPHIIKVLDFGIQDKTPFLVMSYAPNGTLRQLHPKGTVLPVQTAVAYAKQVASALQYLHNQKLIHRDIKPENLLLGPDQEILLSDFGTALIVQTVSVQGDIQEMAGTVTYMAPEQLQGKPRPASDQYGLGVVVYEWLCGEVPFKGTFTELSSQQMLMPPPSLRLKNPEISSQIEEVVMKALSKEPSQRFTNMTAFATALEDAADGNYVSDTLSFPGSSEEITVIIPNPKTPLPETFEEETGILLPEPASKRSVSRRTVIAGISVAALLAAAGGSLVALDLSHILPGSPIPGSTPRSATHSVHTTSLLVYKYTGHTDWVNGLAWSPDGHYIASGGIDETVHIWLADSGKLITRYTGHKNSLGHGGGSVYTVGWSPDGHYVASGAGDKTVQVWKPF
jgi:eukaryotic-like serine/threonine-protein kinase